MLGGVLTGLRSAGIETPPPTASSERSMDTTRIRFLATLSEVNRSGNQVAAPPMYVTYSSLPRGYEHHNGACAVGQAVIETISRKFSLGACFLEPIMATTISGFPDNQS